MKRPEIKVNAGIFDASLYKEYKDAFFIESFYRESIANKHFDFEKSEIKKQMDAFRCKHSDHSIEHFLKSESFGHDKGDITRTYFVKDRKNHSLKAYFSIGIKTIYIGSTEKIEEPAYLLHRLGKDVSCKNLLFPNFILPEIINIISKTRLDVGGVSLGIDCDKENKRLRDYYIGSGFNYIQTEDDKNGKVVRVAQAVDGLIKMLEFLLGYKPLHLISSTGA